MNKFIKTIVSMLNDILFLLGAVFISGATYRIDFNAGLYVTGVFLLVFALLISKKKGGG